MDPNPITDHEILPYRHPTTTGQVAPELTARLALKSPGENSARLAVFPARQGRALQEGVIGLDGFRLDFRVGGTIAGVGAVPLRSGDPDADDASGSKPWHETRVEDPDSVHAMLRDLGYVVTIAFEKRCRNYDITAAGRRMLATLVRVPEIDGHFLEVETIVDEDQVTAALNDIRAVLAELGIAEDDLTTEQYTDAIAARRNT